MPNTPAALTPEASQAKLRLGIVGNTPALIEAVQRAIKVAPIDLSVLVTGESGAGKEFFPQIIHQFSPRKHSKYIAVNCGAIPEGTIDSELFGHEKGSFTGALASRKGYFEEADGGTIFLDEVAELPLTTQARLLRVLETGEFMKVGSSTVQKTNIRVVAATNVDMAKAVAEGRFREDLYYRLSTVQIFVPPLRERGNDIMLLARKFASEIAERYGMPAISFSDDARQLMLRYRWPGNVRQLKNAVEQAAIFQEGEVVDAAAIAKYLPPEIAGAATKAMAAPARAHAYEMEREMLFNFIFRLQQELDDVRQQLHELQDRAAGEKPMSKSLMKVEHVLPRPGAEAEKAPAIIDIDPSEVVAHDPSSEAATPEQPAAPATLDHTERVAIEQALLRNDGRRKQAAKELNISERTLYRKIKEYGLD